MGAGEGAHFYVADGVLIVPTLCVGMQPRMLRVPSVPGLKSAAWLERGASLEAFPRGAWERSRESQPMVIRLALPPAAAVLTLNARSITRRSSAMLVSPWDRP